MHRGTAVNLTVHVCDIVIIDSTLTTYRSKQVRNGILRYAFY
jgi:hypothetical protein